jgi:hypothetical protein
MNIAVPSLEENAVVDAGADRVGVIASVLCAIHCAITPILLLFAPTFGRIWSHPASHWLVALFVVPLALVMVYRGFKVHRKRWIVGAGLVGVLLVIVGAIIPYWESYSRDASAAAALAKDNDVFVWNAGDPMPETDSAADSEVFVWNAGDPMPGTDATTDDGQCLDACCPSLVTDSEGNTQLHIPPASIVTTLGGVALICTHLGNLCACRRQRRTDCCSSPLC